jgi:hypothetical protein
MEMTMKNRLILFFCTLALAGHVAANDAKVPHVSGGIGEDEQQALQAEAANYNLRLSFAEKVSGAYLSDVKVTIRNAADAIVLSAVSEGPWFFVRLAPGRYRITVEADGQPQIRTITLTPGQSMKQNFYWVGKNND